MLTIGLVLVLITVILIGAPLFIVMGATALTLFSLADISTSAVAVEVYKIAAAPTLLTIPLFTFAGYLIAESRSPLRILRFADSLMGRMPGGIAIVSLFVCAFFTAFTGASGVTIIALGGVLYPILRKENFSEDFSLGLLTASGSLGLLFPPSLPIILYGIVAKVDIEKLFRAGILPGLLLIVVLSIWSLINSNSKVVSGPGGGIGLAGGGIAVELKEPFNWKEVGESFKGAIWELMLPCGILIGIYGGIVTPSEAAALTALYVLIMECFIYRDLHLFKDVPKITLDCMSLVGGILLILCCALGVTNYLIDEEIPVMILDFMRKYLTNKYSFLLFLNIFLLIVGSLMDIFSAIIVVVPLIIPIAEDFGVDPIHLAIIFLTNLEIGYITPPVGINLFISSFRFKRSITTLYKASLPFVILLLLALLVITYVPSLSLFLVEGL